MHCFLLQDWLLVRMPTSTTTITQSEHAWLDLADYRDVVFWYEVKEVSNGGGTLTIALQTGPSKDEEFFTALVSPTVVVGAGAIVVHHDWATVPLARWLRWQLIVSGTVTTTPEITFRIWVAVATGRQKAGGAARPWRRV
jgi:hypothetical protein